MRVVDMGEDLGVVELSKAYHRRSSWPRLTPG
jgi:hypothetical protein